MNEKTKILANAIVSQLTAAGRDDIVWMSILLYSFKKLHSNNGRSTLIDDLLDREQIKAKGGGGGPQTKKP